MEPGLHNAPLSGACLRSLSLEPRYQVWLTGRLGDAGLWPMPDCLADQQEPDQHHRPGRGFRDSGRWRNGRRHGRHRRGRRRRSRWRAGIAGRCRRYDGRNDDASTPTARGQKARKARASAPDLTRRNSRRCARDSTIKGRRSGRHDCRGRRRGEDSGERADRRSPDFWQSPLMARALRRSMLAVRQESFGTGSWRAKLEQAGD